MKHIIPHRQEDTKPCIKHPAQLPLFRDLNCDIEFKKNKKIMKALRSGKGKTEQKNRAKSNQATKSFLCTHKTCKQ